MNFNVKKILFFALSVSLLSSCVSKKEMQLVQSNLTLANAQLGKCGESLNDYMKKLAAAEQEKELKASQGNSQMREEQIKDLKDQVADTRKQRDKTVEQVGDLTVLSQSASNNIKATLSQLEGKDKYIKLLQAAKSKADSINLALAVNLKGVLKDGVNDKDVDIKVDKTVVFINLSDNMLFLSGSATITNKANDVLGKIAKIVESRPDLEVMVEGYTDNQPISKTCIDDNWDLSVKRATSVVRVLQKTFKIDPNRLIAAGRGEYNTLAPNDSVEGRATNRRTRIIILPKLNQFYDLLNPANVPD
jgi:chemotaxis protein MotB